MALRLRQSLHLTQNGLHPLRFIQRLVSWHTRRDQTLCKTLIHLLRPYAPPAINSKVPRDSNQPNPHIPHIWQGAAALDNTNKGILNYILSLCARSKNRMSYAE